MPCHPSDCPVPIHSVAGPLPSSDGQRPCPDGRCSNRHPDLRPGSRCSLVALMGQNASSGQIPLTRHGVRVEGRRLSGDADLRPTPSCRTAPPEPLMSRQRAALRHSLKALTGAAVLGALLALPVPAGAAAKEPAKPAAAKAARPAKSSAPAAPACYNRTEHAAEQLMRLHTEMMVVGLTCRTVVPEKKPFDLYQDFSVKNRALLSSSEASLISFYKRSGSGGNATRQFDMFRTELANEISRRAATIGIPQYCANFVDRSVAAKDLTADDLRTLTSDEKGAGLMHLASRPLCDVKVVSNPDPVFAVAQATPAPAAPKATTAKAKPAKAAAPAKPKQKVAAAPAKQSVAVR
ncbi:hypothetical protein FZ942_30355 [Azospirillum lipoferum]|uniref:Uncharacterized protein n=2 Tax=Azospirillaceae TaxID=2829815 RepID=A0A5A9GBX7_AZOLI|nr:hypothetical protein FZ942_30355 [Azospirillum lipoferum]